MISLSLNASLARQYGSSRIAGLLKEAFDRSQLPREAASAIVDSFDSECCVVFSDISGFSQAASGVAPAAVGDFLNGYYSRLLPIVYEHGGLVDQMMGDGVISVFSAHLGPPSRMKGGVFMAGLTAAQAIVEEFAGEAACSTKCALHKGTACVCLVGDANYKQATLVGDIMTKVYRVESVARDESVNMLLSMPEAAVRYALWSAVSRSPSASQRRWVHATFSAQLQGLGQTPQSILSYRFCG